MIGDKYILCNQQRIELGFLCVAEVINNHSFALWWDVRTIALAKDIWNSCCHSKHLSVVRTLISYHIMSVSHKKIDGYLLAALKSAGLVPLQALSINLPCCNSIRYNSVLYATAPKKQSYRNGSFCAFKE